MLFNRKFIRFYIPITHFAFNQESGNFQTPFQFFISKCIRELKDYELNYSFPTSPHTFDQLSVIVKSMHKEQKLYYLPEYLFSSDYISFLEDLIYNFVENQYEQKNIPLIQINSCFKICVTIFYDATKSTLFCNPDLNSYYFSIVLYDTLNSNIILPLQATAIEKNVLATLYDLNMLKTVLYQVIQSYFIQYYRITVELSNAIEYNQNIERIHYTSQKIIDHKSTQINIFSTRTNSFFVFLCEYGMLCECLQQFIKQNLIIDTLFYPNQKIHFIR